MLAVSFRRVYGRRCHPFVELGKLTPEQYEGITGEKYDASVVEQQETVQ
ncbi:XkdX family protein [Brevibacillus sp. HB1.2]|nr:XkdX family protein [Brevibacillus sp. HB1.2]NTU20808.1 XkdX family protein [Brevibacillus sp. HB1.2]NTU32527.1 XkdX family protein [Brevibacillus sp. HB1.1]